MATSKIKRETFMDVGTLRDITDLLDIPLNSFGYVGITDASINPKGSTGAMYAYVCFGVSNRRCIIASYTASGDEMYVNNYHTDTWKGWKRITLV